MPATFDKPLALRAVPGRATRRPDGLVDALEVGIGSGRQVRFDKHATKGFDDLWIVVHAEIWLHAKASAQPLLAIVEHRLAKAIGDIRREAMPFDDVRPDDLGGADTRPHKDAVPVVDEPAKYVLNQWPQRSILTEDGLIHVEENVHNVPEERRGEYR